MAHHIKYWLMSEEGEGPSSFVICNIGTSCCSVGTSDELHVTKVPTMVGKEKIKWDEVGKATNPVFGTDAIEKRDKFHLFFPTNHIDDWGSCDMEEFLFHLFGINVENFEEFPFLLPISSTMPIETKKKLVEMMFCMINVPIMCLPDESLLISHYAGLSTALVLDLSHQTARAIPVIEKEVRKEHISSNDRAGGKSITNDIVAHADLFHSSCSDWIVAKEVKEKLGTIITKEEESKDERKPKQFSPTKGNEGFTVDAMKLNSLITNHFFSEESNIALLIRDTIEKCGNTKKEELYKHILVCGGSSQFPGLEYRLQQEVIALLPGVDVCVRVVHPDSAWLAGAQLAPWSIENSISSWIVREDYEDAGPEAIHQNVEFPMN